MEINMVKIKLEDMIKKDNTYAYNVITGNKLFTAVYQRRYFLKVLAIDHESIGAEVTSVDYVPSGYEYSGSEKDFGVHVFKYENLDDINDTGLELWKTVIGTVDPDFLKHVG